ncbi:MAG: hypothetical protein P9M14_11900 [Candidatus Alcyoniella australis]|nr:hypothetical protein [Candidatus Alcyoniella australis]
MNGSRGLSEKFLQQLESGLMHPVLERVRNDTTLNFQIRDDYINLYYRGGNLSRISRNPQGEFSVAFDSNYFKGIAAIKPNLPKALTSPQHVAEWLDALPMLKQGMDLWFAKHPRDEKEIQQRIARINNIGKVAKGTDYFICDFEYQSKEGRFDLVGVRWPSKGSIRKRNRGLTLSFVEVKYADSALKGKAGIVAHLADIKKFSCIQSNLTGLADEMKTVFNQKRRLGLIDNQKDIESFDLSQVELMFILANHDPESKILSQIIGKQKMIGRQKVEVTFATANFMGYGLYLEGIFSLADFMKKYPKRI